MGRMRRTASLAFAVAAALAGIASSARADETPLAFSAAVVTELPEPFFPTMFRARDLDGDGKPDLVVAGRDPENRLLVLAGNGLGGFSVRQTLATEGFTDWLELADLDGDGRDDIVTAWRGDVPRLVYHRALGKGVFAEATVLAGVEEGMGRDPQGLAVGDVDGDGDIDVAVGLYAGQAVDLFRNDGLVKGVPSFARMQRVRLGTFLGGFAYPRVIVLADVDGDNDLDLLANELGGGRLAVALNHGGRVGRVVEHRTPMIGAERPGMAHMQVVDIDGDGDLDAACPALLLGGEQKVFAFVNDGDGGFSERIVGTGAPTGYAFTVHFADLDGDGDLDAVTGAALPGLVAFGRRLDGVAFDFEIDIASLFGQLVRHLETVDLDGDCDLDLIGIDGPGRIVFARRNNTPQAGGCGGVAEAAVKSAAEAADAVATEEVGSREKRMSGPSGRPAWLGDVDGDGAVDAADLAAWLAGRSRTERSKGGAR
jgi:hypothetical protein